MGSLFFPLGLIIFVVMELPTIFPGNLSIIDFDYNLPKERIANYPLSERDLSKLLVYKNGAFEDSVYQNLPDYIPEKSLMVFNETKVVHARLLFLQSNGAHIEIFCLEPASAEDEISLAMQKKGDVLWGISGNGKIRRLPNKSMWRVKNL
jgi:S-adenosylmethionine:tRNA ribosyltransferase-isomerase